VAAGRGVAFVPASATRLGVPGVAHVPLATPVPEPVELHLLWTRHSGNPALQRVLAVLDDAVAVSRDA
jgi:DNA-binding transcriptional LysR family regulator